MIDHLFILFSLFTLSLLVGISIGLKLNQQRKNKPKDHQRTSIQTPFSASTTSSCPNEIDLFNSVLYAARTIIATIRSDGTMDYINPYGEEFTGYSKEEIASQPYFWFDHFIPTETRPDIELIMQQALGGNDVIKQKTNGWINRQGEERIFEWSNTLTYINEYEGYRLVTIGIDITERLNAETALKNLNNSLETRIQNAVSDLININKSFEEAQHIAKIGNFEHNLATGIFIASPEFYHIYDIDPKVETINKNTLLQKLSPESRAEFLQIQASTNNSFNNKFEHHSTIHTHSGIKHILTKWKNTTDNQGNVLIAKGTSQDITERVLSQQKIQEQALILHHQQGLVLKGEMINMIAHQWRQPLNNLSMMSFLIEKHIKQEKFEQALQGQEKIRNQIQYLSKTISDFQHFFTNNKESTTFILADEINATLNIIEHRLHRHHITLNLIGNTQISMNTYANELGQVMVSILNNAIDHLKASQQSDPNINIHAEAKAGQLILKIMDNANGIPEGLEHKIFEPYFTTKFSAQGTGLGLYIVKTLTQHSLKGTVVAYNNPDQGACFHIEIPINLNAK